MYSDSTVINHSKKTTVINNLKKIYKFLEYCTNIQYIDSNEPFFYLGESN